MADDELETYRAEAVLELLNDLGISTEEVRNLAWEVADIRDKVSPLEVIKAKGEIEHAPLSEDNQLNGAAVIAEDIIRVSSRGMAWDWKFDNLEKEAQLSSVLQNFGYDIEFRDIEGNKIGDVLPSQFPDQFRIALMRSDGDDVGVVEFPPDGGDPDNPYLLISEINENLLDRIDLRIEELVAYSGDHSHWIVIEEDRLKRAHKKYGERIEIGENTLL